MNNDNLLISANVTSQNIGGTQNVPKFGAEL